MVTANIKKQEGDRTTLTTQGTVDGKVVASARLVVEAFQLADRYPRRADAHDYILREVRNRFARVLAGMPEHPSNPAPSMRWMWLDRFVEFIRGQRAVAIKNVSLAEEPLSDYVPGFPVLPCSLIVEGLAWTGGILANDQCGFRERMSIGQGQPGRVPPPSLARGPTPLYRRTRSDRGRGGIYPRNEPRRGRTAGRGRVLFLAHLPERFDAVDGDLVEPAESGLDAHRSGCLMGRCPAANLWTSRKNCSRASSRPKRRLRDWPRPTARGFLGLNAL